CLFRIRPRGHLCADCSCCHFGPIFLDPRPAVSFCGEKKRKSTHRIMNESMELPAEWYAVYTRSRHEKKVAEFLSEKAVEVFLQLRNVLRRRKDRRKWVELPLFSGYVFVRISRVNKLRVLQTQGVVNILGDTSGPSPVPEEQIESIKKLVDSG